MTSTRLLTAGNNNQIGYSVRGYNLQNNHNNNNNKTGLIKPKNSPQKRIQRPCMNKPTVWMLSPKSVPPLNGTTGDNNIKRSAKQPPPTPNNTPYPSKTFCDGSRINSLEKSQNYMLIANELFVKQNSVQPAPTENISWKDVLSINSSKSESLSHESRKNKHHNYITQKSHSQRHIKKNEQIIDCNNGQNNQKSSTDRKLNLLIFNPHRTLQFLVSELKSHLRSPKSDDKNVQNILSEIQQTIKRLEPSNIPISETTSTSHSTQENQENQAANLDNQENRVNKTNNSSCQTDNNNLSICEIVGSSSIQQTDNNNNYNNNNKQNDLENLEFKTKMEIFELEIKKNYEILTENCKLLENTCKSLTNEKTKISFELSKSQTEISSLKNQISMLQGALKDAANQEKSTTQNLKEQYKSLHEQLKTLQDSVTKKETDELLTVGNLSTKLKESSARILALEKSGIDSKKLFVLTKLENEKLMIMEKYRTHQINSMQNNINDIHKFIRRELKELQQYLCNSSHKDITDKISQYHQKIKLPLKKLNIKLKTNSKLIYPSMNSTNLKLLSTTTKSIKNNNKIENLITTNSSCSADGSNNYSLQNINENFKSLKTRKNIKNQPFESSEPSSTISTKENNNNNNKIDVVQNEENDDDDDNDKIDKNIKKSKLQQEQHYQHYSNDKNMKNYQTIKNDSKNMNTTGENFQLKNNKNDNGKFSTDAYNNLFEINSNLIANGKNVMTSYDCPSGNIGIRSTLKPSGTIHQFISTENRNSMKIEDNTITNNTDITLPNLNIIPLNRIHFSNNVDTDDNDEHKIQHYNHQQQIDSNNEFNNKKLLQCHSQVKKSNEIVVDGGERSSRRDGNFEYSINDQNNSINLDHYHYMGDNNGNNYKSNYHETTTNKNNYQKNENENHIRTKSKNKNSSIDKDYQMSPSNKHKRSQSVQWKKYYWSKMNEENDQEQKQQQSDGVGGCGDCFKHITKQENEIPILQYTSNFDEFRTMLDDVIPSTDLNDGSESNRNNNNNNKIDISSDLNNSTSFDLSQTEYTSV